MPRHRNLRFANVILTAVLNTRKKSCVASIMGRVAGRLGFVVYALCIVAFFADSQRASADFKILPSTEGILPSALSSSKYANSPSKYSNSPSKYSNSASKLANSSSRYANSPYNSANRRTGHRRLFIGMNATAGYIGYYALTDDGLMNFFSSKGARLFYSPYDTDALFENQSGKFCGTLAIVRDEGVVILTENGRAVMSAFLKSTELLPSLRLTKGAVRPNATRSQVDGSFRGWDGDTIFKLTNGQIWQQAEYDYEYHYAYRPAVAIVKTSKSYIMHVKGMSETLMVERVQNFISAYIDGSFQGWDGDTIFKLTNGQIWQQAEYDYEYHYAYRPAVTIIKISKGYIMQVEGMSDTLLVKRIR